jgi:CRP-like cAMP-binding protein
MNTEYISKLLSKVNIQIHSYKKDALIASEGDLCSNMGFILKGQIDVLKSNASGNIVVVYSLKQGDSFGDALVFAEVHEYPSSLLATKESKVLMISSADILALCEKDHNFQRNLIKSLSERIIYLNQKVKILSHRTIRQKLSYYILEESQKQKSLDLKCRHTRSDIADLIGSTRPSVSRELSNMQSKGIIRLTPKSILILNKFMLEELL